MSTPGQNVKPPSIARFRRAVNVELARREWTQATLAHHISRSRQAVSRALNKGEFPRVAAQIVQTLGL